MRASTAVVMLFLAAGCASPETPELDYLPPSGEPAADRSAFVRQQPWLVWGNILDHLQQQGARVSVLDEAAGELVVIYSGDPQPYVDCGWIVIYQDNEFDHVPAAGSDARFLRPRDGEVVTLERKLRLDARMSVRVEPSGQDAIVRTDSTYRLTKTSARLRRSSLFTPRRSTFGQANRVRSAPAPRASRTGSWSVWCSTPCPRYPWPANSCGCGDLLLIRSRPGRLVGAIWGSRLKQRRRR
jgi:hypothetical protein